jgi:predicted RNA-binding Zn-ribbon protein involved in translation (DUF1610 family)
MDCGAVISERCANCGLTATPIGLDLYKCTSCGKHWEKGEDARASHGLCPVCYAKRRQSVQKIPTAASEDS